MEAPATNHTPPPMHDRPQKVYHKRSVLDWAILVVVVGIACVVIALSYGNTASLALVLGLNATLTAGMVEVLFASLLFIRGRQRALQRNVPLFLHIGYFSSLAFVTGVNMWGLGQLHPIGYIVGAAITGAMWLMESTLVWLWVDSHHPHKKRARELKKEAKREIKELKTIQAIQWMRAEAQKPDLALIKKARKAEDKRQKVVVNGLPEFFANTEHQTSNTGQKTNVEHQTEQTNEQTDQMGQTEQAKQTTDNEQTNNKQPNKIVYINSKQTAEQTTKQQEGKPNSKQPATEQTERKRTASKQTKRTAKRTTGGPTYEQLLDLLNKTYESNKQLPTVRAFAKQAGIKPGRAYTAITMWREENEQQASNK
jgi:hypothetical protein